MNEQQNLRVVVVDDSEVVRMKMRGLLEATSGFELVGEATDGESGLRVVQGHQPDLVVMDLRMPGMTGIEATWQLGTIAPSSRVVVLTVSAEQEDVTDAIMAGARGYVVKGARDEEILGALRGVAAGERVISPQVAGKLIDRVRGERPGEKATTPSPAAPAAPRVPTPKPKVIEKEKIVEKRVPVHDPGPFPIGMVLAFGIVGAAIVTGISEGQTILDGNATSDTLLKAIANLIAVTAAVGLAVMTARD